MSQNKKDQKDSQDSKQNSSAATANSSASSKTQQTKTKSSNLLKHFIAYTIVIAIVGGLGYLYYETYLVNQLLIETNKASTSQNTQQLKQLQAEQAATTEELTRKYDELHKSAIAEKKQLEQLGEASELFQQQIPLIQQQIKPRELWQIQLSQLLFLAEQERVLGTRPTSISYLLQQVEQLLLSVPVGDRPAQLLQLVDQDIRSYKALSTINLANIYQDINIIEGVLINDLKFNSSFYDEIASDEESNSLQADKLSGPQFWQKFVSRISNYIRISRDSEPSQILTQDKRELTLSSISLMLNQAKFALIKGDGDLYYAILEDLKEDILKLFVEGLERNRMVDLIDQLIGADILPKELPALTSYEFFSRS